MKRRNCKACRFFVEQSTPICANCGALLFRHPSESTVNVAALLFVFAAVYLYGIVSGIGNRGGDEKSIYISIGLIILGFLGYAILSLLAKRILDSMRRNTLQSSENTIGRRIQELCLSQAKIQETMALTTEGATSFGHLAHETLTRAQSALSALIDEYKVKLWEIESIRFLNQIEAHKYASTCLTYEDCKAAMLEMARLEASCLRRMQEWSKLSLANSPPGRRCIEKCKATVSLVHSIREEMIAGQVRRAVKNVSPFGEKSVPDTGFSVIPDLNFTGQINTLCLELQKLEDENIRLKSEQEVMADSPGSRL